MKHGKWLSWLKANAGVLGFESDRTARRLIKLAESYRTPASDMGEAEAVQISRQTWGHDKNISLKWTGDPENYTPAKYIEEAREVMGGIDLDPASNMTAQKTVQAAEWYDEGKDGLAQDWQGTIFLNPPFSYPTIEKFIDKLCAEIEAGNVTTAILLTNNNTDTKWWRRASRLAEAICFTAGRINFYKADDSIVQPTNGQTFFYFGPNVSRFAHAFGSVGGIFVQLKRKSPATEGTAPG